ncbi:MAG: alkaline phosphatase D family protein [Kineosporiaceae bacterium]
MQFSEKSSGPAGGRAGEGGTSTTRWGWLRDRALRRRSVLGMIGAGSVGVAAAGTAGRAIAGATKPPGPSPSFTSTKGAPKVVAAHAAVLGLTTADPVPRQQRLQVVVHTTEPCAVKIQASGGDPVAQFESPWVATRVGLDETNPVNSAKILMPAGCGEAGSAWIWRVLLAPRDTEPVAGPEAATVTDPAPRIVPVRPAPGVPSAFRVATGSCSQVAHAGQRHRGVPAAATMAASGLTEFVHMGDTSYVDTWKEFLESTPQQKYTKFAWGTRMHVSQPDFAGLYAKTPMRVVMDDHEAGPGNCYGLNVYPEARQVFEDTFAGTSFVEAGFDFDAPASVSYDHWSIGEADFFLLDNRMWRDGGTRKTGVYRGQKYVTQLGQTQQRWLIRQLRASKAPVKIIYCPRSFRHFYARQEQIHLLDVITGRDGGPAVSGLVIFATGDMHAAAISKLDGKAAVYEVQCAPLLNSTLHTMKPLLDWQIARGYQLIFMNTIDGKTGQAVSNAWGEFEIDTRDPAAKAVTVRLHRDTGEVIKELRIPVPSATTPSPTTTSPSPTTTSPSPTPTNPSPSTTSPSPTPTSASPTPTVTGTPTSSPTATPSPGPSPSPAVSGGANLSPAPQV